VILAEPLVDPDDPLFADELDSLPVDIVGPDVLPGMPGNEVLLVEVW
jgi:hypothetical protein